MTIEKETMLPRLILAVLLALSIAACTDSDTARPDAGQGGNTFATEGVGASDRSCDDAPFPSQEWESCEFSNFARQDAGFLEQFNPEFFLRGQEQSLANIQQWLERALADPSWLDPRSGNTPVTPVSATWELGLGLGDPYRYPDAPGPDGADFYNNEADVIPIVIFDRDCARLSGRVWAPKGSKAGSDLPQVIIENGSLQAGEPLYWWAAQPLVRAGYAVMTFDPRSHGRSDFVTPGLEPGSNVNSKAFWENLVDAIDFFHSTPEQPYPHNESCTGTYPTEVTAFNPIWNRIDVERLGIAGHSLGAISVSVVQGYGAPGADPWPGLMDSENPVKAAGGWDSMITPDGHAFAPADSGPLPSDVVAALLQVGTEFGLSKFGARAPTLNFNADYGLISANVPYLTPPDPERHKQVHAVWQTEGVPVYTLGFQGTNHLDYSLTAGAPATSWCPDTSSGACRGGWGRPAITHYTVAWFDRWLKQPGEPGYANADARLLDDGGEHGADKMSFRFHSARDFPDRSGRRHRCEDIRAGCKK